MSNTRHVVVLRKDLKFPAGLVAAQAAHISDAFMRDRIVRQKKFSTMEQEWMVQPYITILAVQGIEELELIRNEALANKLQVHEWRDTVISPTLKRKVEAFVGISIGPDDSDRLAKVTSQLELY
jgi:peptidyl-tRNA hydrolase